MNSKNLLAHYGRFKGLEWFDKVSQSRVFIGGAGGIGSWLSLFLTRAGADVITLDMDTVEDHNIGGQLYGTPDIGKTKVEALTEVINRLCGKNAFTGINMKVEEGGDWQRFVTMSDIVCVGFDNLEARKVIYDYWKKAGKEHSLFIDGRLTAESMQIFVVDKKAPDFHFTEYEKTYFAKEEILDLPCTAKATSHCGAMIASYMTSMITNWSANEVGSCRSVSNIEVHLPIMLIQPSYFIEPKVEEYAGINE